MEKTRFSEFTLSELNCIKNNLRSPLLEENLKFLIDELKKEIKRKSENKYRHELNYINESIEKMKKRKKDLELFLKINPTQTDL